MKQKIFFIAFLIGVFGLTKANAQLLQWNTFGNAGTETTEPSVSNNSNISAANLTLGSGVTSAANGNRLGGSSWFDTGDTNPTTLAESIAGNDYIQFIVTPLSGATFTPTSLVFSWDHSATGPGSLALRSSVDGFAANLGSVTGLAASVTTGNTINITGLNNISTATTFRLYGYGATATGGTGGFDTATNVVNVVLNGTSTAACTPPTISSVSPSSGIVGSQVTITASAGSLSGATAVFNGVGATTVSSSATQLVVTVPTGATTGNLVITDALLCSATTTTFTVLTTPCGMLSDLIISEVTDTNYGGLSYIEIYNGTGAPVDLSAYNLQFYSNGSGTPYATTGLSGVPAFSGTLANDDTYTISTGTSASVCGITGGDGTLADLITAVNGVNFGVGADDQIILYKGSTKIDSWGDATGNWSSATGIGTSGADFRRNPTAATLPNPNAYSNSDWTIIDWAGSGIGACSTNDYSNINSYSYTPATSTTWNGTSWSNGNPSLSKMAIIDGQYNTSVSGNFEACSLIVKEGRKLVIDANQYVTIQYNLTVKPTGNIIVNDNGSLVQIDDSGVNSGSIDIYRTATIKKTDYVYWSSPVSGFGVQNVSSGSPTSLIFKWNTTQANSNGGEGNWENTSETMQVGKGYIIRGPDSYNNTTATDFTAKFSGTPFNGIYQPSIYRGNDTNAGTAGPNGIMRTIKDDNWNLLGNPYPSSISAIKFLTLNTNIDGNIRLWTHGTLPSAAVLDPFYGNFVYNYDPSDYITYNITGTSSGPSAFNGYIASGQGFFVIMNDGAAATQTVTFNNSLRETVGPTNTYYDNSYFYRSADTNKPPTTGQKGRIWLDLINNNTNKSSRALVGYLSGATLAKDRLYDAFFVVGNSMSIFSMLNDEAMSIQGRPVPFDKDDVVPIGVKIHTAGSHTIALGAIDGLFESGGKNIYLEDTMTGIVHDLKAAPYSFTSAAGKFTNRFKLRYENRTETEDKPVTAEKVLVYSNPNSITAHSFSEKIANVKVYDMLGRVIDDVANVNNQEITINLNNLNHQPVIVKIVLENNEIVTKKIIF